MTGFIHFLVSFHADYFINPCPEHINARFQNWSFLYRYFMFRFVSILHGSFFGILSKCFSCVSHRTSLRVCFFSLLCKHDLNSLIFNFIGHYLIKSNVFFIISINLTLFFFTFCVHVCLRVGFFSVNLVLILKVRLLVKRIFKSQYLRVFCTLCSWYAERSCSRFLFSVFMRLPAQFCYEGKICVPLGDDTCKEFLVPESPRLVLVGWLLTWLCVWLVSLLFRIDLI